MNSHPCQVVAITIDGDTGILDLRLADGGIYRVANPHYAKTIRKSVSPGGMISEEQRIWLERYRLGPPEGDRVRVLGALRELRLELKPRLKG